MDGILNVCKPRGVSSFRALSIVKNKLADELGIKPKQLKVGHLGTLDPLAMGVLVLMCGKATKLADKLHSPFKTYQTLLHFSKETDTLDSEGQVIATSDVIPTREQIEKIIPEMVGDIEIEVPKFSAVHINGKRAYDLARQGIDFTPPKKFVNIHRFELLEQRSEKEFFFEIECQTGTYIRSLAKLIAQKLGTVAYCLEIIRTRVGDFKIEEAKSLEDVTISDMI
ncbi:MAG: tRNA pseudouridine(55) synthase TruB [Firmicutes bacterium]|nr:tRNA pseudouridine(55) synthase TruB [Bacillota bacterium]